MKRRTMILLAACILMAALVTATKTASTAADGAGSGYTPVAPAAAIHFSTQAQLNLVRDWLDQKDYPSAAASVAGLAALVDLLGCQGNEPAWQEKIKALRTASEQLGSAARNKDRVECDKQCKECDRLLTELAKEKAGSKASRSASPASAGTRTWMLLLDGTYSDARTTKSAKEMEQHAFTIAEEANLVAQLRKEGNWRDTALEVRQLALTAAEKAKAGDLDQARVQLKAAYQRCEFCHQGFKR
jgi:hypothetical protein